MGEVRHRQGLLLGRMQSLGFDAQREAALETLTEDILKSSEIEGETLDKDQVRSSIARRLGLDIGASLAAERHVEGVVEMTIDAIQNYRKPLTTDRLFDWHAALFPTGRSGMTRIVVGDWRDDRSGPMQVVSGPFGHERVHYEAPAADRLPAEMERFLDWFNGDLPIDPVLKAAIAHLWYVTIHPFDDGNGRIARAIADMALARSEASAQRFYSMSAQIRLERKDYYDILEQTQKGELDITAWLNWFLGCLERAFDGAEEILANVLRKARFWKAMAGEPLNERQRKVVGRMLDGFEGRLTSSKWAAIAKTSPDTALRDIDDLLRRRILVKEAAGGRSTSYRLVVTPADALNAVASYARAHSAVFVHGATRPSEEEKTNRQARVEALSLLINQLAEASKDRRFEYREFEAILKDLHQEGIFPYVDLVSAVAFSLRRSSRDTP